MTRSAKDFAVPSRREVRGVALAQRTIRGGSLGAALVGVGLSMVCVREARTQCNYEVTVITGPECGILGPDPTRGVAINEAGEVCGYYTRCELGANLAYVWTPETGLVTLSIPGSDESYAQGTSVGYVVGHYDNPSDNYTLIGFIMQGKELIGIRPPAGGAGCTAWGVNNVGQVVGETGLPPPAGGVEAFLWESGVMTIIDPSPTAGSIALDVNDMGVIAGYFGDTAPSQPTSRGFIWDDGDLTVLPPVPGGLTSTAVAINGAGQVVGGGLVPSPAGLVSHPLLWTDGVMTDIGLLPGFDRCSAVDINDHGAVVGSCNKIVNPNDRAAFLWWNGTMWNLGDLVLSDFPLDVINVGGINNAGQIVLTGTVPIIGTAAILLTPKDVPVGDIDVDCRVGIVDFLYLLSAWGSCGKAGNCPGDLDGSSAVDDADLFILLKNWS